MRLMSVFAAGLGLAAMMLPLHLSAQQPAAAEPISSARAAPAASSLAPPALTRSDLESWLDGFMTNAMARGGVPGASVVVVKNGQVLLEKGYGFSDTAQRKLVDPERTMFRLGSISKLVTWTAVMQQVEAGRLDLDRDVNAYLDFRVPPFKGQPLTLRNLMTHTTGFEGVGKGIISSDPRPDSLEAVVKGSLPKRLRDPGRTPAYSNYAAALAGYIVERVSGQSFADYVDQHIFQSLGMERSSFNQPLKPRLQPFMSKGYQFAGGAAQPYETVALSPAGAGAATPADMSRFMIAHLQDGAAGSGRILQPATVRLMHDSVLTIIPNLNRMALGFWETNVNGRRVIGHGGDTQWFHGDMHLFVDDGVGLFVVMNSPGKDGASSTIRSSLFRMFSDRYFPATRPETALDAATANRHARMIAGDYQIPGGSETNFFSVLNLLYPTSVTANTDGTISVSMLQDPAGQPRKWRETTPFLWREVGGWNRLAAVVVDGKVVRFSEDEISPVAVFEPVPWQTSPRWLMPALMGALIALAATALGWPLQALIRRRYGVAFPLVGKDARAYRWVRIAILASLLTSLGWLLTFAAMFTNNDLMSSRIDGWLLALIAATLISFTASCLAALWNLWVVWTGQQGWAARSWAIAIAGSCLILFWTATVFHLMQFNVSY